MGKKQRNKRQKDQQRQQEHKPILKALPVEKMPSPVEDEAISANGKKTIGGGIIILILGFYILTLTDSHGRNWASTVSPLLILGAYAVIAYGIFLPGPAVATKAEGSETS